MKSSYTQTFLAAVALVNILHAFARTPPGLSPGIENSVSVTFGGSNVTNGTYVPLQGRNIFSYTLYLY